MDEERMIPIINIRQLAAKACAVSCQCDMRVKPASHEEHWLCVKHESPEARYAQGYRAGYSRATKEYKKRIEELEAVVEDYKHKEISDNY